MPKSVRQKPAAKPFNGSMTRAFAGSPTSVDAESCSFAVVMVTSTPVRRIIDDPRDPSQKITVDEVIDPAGVDLTRAHGMPLVDGHKTDGGIGAILGKVDNPRLEGDQIVGDAMLASSHAHLISDIQRGFYRQGSVGYDILEAELIDGNGEVPTLLITRSMITEYSLVPVGADENSFIRGKADKPITPKITFRAAGKEQEKPTMTLKRGKRSEDLEAVIVAAEEAVAAVDEVLAELDAADTQDELVERARALRGKREYSDEEAKAEDEPKRKRADDDEAKAEEERKRKRADEDTEEDKAELENLRSAARSLGLSSIYDALRVTRAKPAQIMAALNETVATRGAQAAPDAAVTIKPSQRSAVEAFDPSAVFTARNKR